MKGEIEVYFPQRIYEILKEKEKEVNDNYLLSNLDLRKKIFSNLREEFDKYFVINSLVVLTDSDEEERLKLSMKFLNDFLEIYHINTLAANIKRKDFIKNFILISNKLSIYLNKKSSETH